MGSARCSYRPLRGWALVGPDSLPFPNLANLPLCVSSCRYLVRSFRPSNTAIQISQLDFILVSRIFFISPGPRASPSPFFCPLPRLRTRAPYVINAGNSVYAQSIRSRGLQVRPHVRDLTYWTVYTLRVSMLRAVPRRHIRANRYKTLSFFFQTYHISLAD